MRGNHHSRFEGVRAALVAVAISSGLVGFGLVLNRHYPIADWLFWKYAKALALVSFWSVSCVSFGLASLQRLKPGLPFREELVFAAACGVYAFYALQFLGGLLGLFGPTWALALPAGMLAVGLLGSRTKLKRLWRHRRLLPSFSLGVSASWQVPVAVFGIACLLGIYLGILTPRNAAFDSTWYHLGLGQGWAADGGIARSAEGWFVEALPNMAAVLYSWGFLVPGLDLFEMVMVAAHIEFALFLMTLASIPVLVRWLLPGSRVGISWVALFLFPSVFIYDAGLHSGNDHVAAFWAVPILLAMRRAWPALDARSSALLALCAAGAILTKYQAASLVLGPALALLGRAVYLGVKGQPASTWALGSATALVSGLLLSSPLWLKNWVWYGDPLFPALYKHFSLRPWHEDMAAVMEQNWSRLVRRPRGTSTEKLLRTLQTGWTFSFVSFTKGRFHGQMPYFGSLFTLSALWLPFVRGAKRSWAVFVLTMLGVFFWFNFSHVERYLQALIPWMAAVVASAVVLAWRTGWLARLPIVLLVLLQAVWGGDALFIRSHAMLQELPFVDTARLIESGFKGKTQLREQFFGTLQQIGKELPRGATALLHGTNPRMGLGTRVVTDMVGFQSGIQYGRVQSREEMYELYRDLGITHIVWRKSKTHGRDTLAGDLRFFDFVSSALEARRDKGSMAWGKLPEEPPAAGPSELVLYAGCLPAFAPGVYRLSDLNVANGAPRVKPLRPMPEAQGEIDQLAQEAGFIVYGPKCKDKVKRPATGGFTRATMRGGEELWVRKR